MGTCFIYLCLETKINPNKYDETKKKQKNKNKHENYYLRCTMIAIDDTLPKMEVFIYLFKQIYIFFSFDSLSLPPFDPIQYFQHFIYYLFST